MTPLRVLAAGIATGTLLLTGCQAEEPPPEFDYPVARQVPDPSEYPNDDQETTPHPDNAVAELKLDNGAQVVFWIDPQNIRVVRVQHSDPDDKTRWTEPEQIYTSGAGCLWLDAASDGTSVAASLNCYEYDPWTQQVPDQVVAVASSDLSDFEIRGLGEYMEGLREKDGTYIWGRSLEWNEDDGWSGDRA